MVELKASGRHGRPSQKRRLSEVGEVESPPSSNRPRRGSYVHTRDSHECDALSSSPPLGFQPLPSISSWLPESSIDTRAPSSKEARFTGDPSSYLPSPPCSTHFDPIRNIQYPPSLRLMSSSSSSLSSSSSSRPDRTPEDETAASMLLRMSTSPAFRPVPQTPKTLSPVEGNLPLGKMSMINLNATLGSSSSASPVHVPPSPPEITSYDRLQAQTPASLLGLTHLLRTD